MNIFLAISSNDISYVQMYIENKFDLEITDKKNTLLMFAVELEKVEIIKMLIDANVNINRQYNNNSALILAVKQGNYEITEMLLDAGANVDMQNDDGLSALDIALNQDRFSHVIQLLQKKSNRNFVPSREEALMALNTLMNYIKFQ